MKCVNCGHDLEKVDGKWLHKWRYKTLPNFCNIVTSTKINKKRNTVTIDSCGCFCPEIKKKVKKTTKKDLVNVTFIGQQCGGMSHSSLLIAQLANKQFRKYLKTKKRVKKDGKSKR